MNLSQSGVPFEFCQEMISAAWQEVSRMLNLDQDGTL